MRAAAGPAGLERVRQPHRQAAASISTLPRRTYWSVADRWTLSDAVWPRSRWLGPGVSRLSSWTCRWWSAGLRSVRTTVSTGRRNSRLPTAVMSRQVRPRTSLWSEKWGRGKVFAIVGPQNQLYNFGPCRRLRVIIASLTYVWLCDSIALVVHCHQLCLYFVA